MINNGTVKTFYVPKCSLHRVPRKSSEPSFVGRKPCPEVFDRSPATLVERGTCTQGSSRQTPLDRACGYFICRLSILAVRFKTSHFVWSSFKNNPERYFYSIFKKVHDSSLVPNLLSEIVYWRTQSNRD